MGAMALLVGVVVSVGGWHWAPASPSLLARCRTTARTVGYAVPCPTRVPVGLYRGASVEGTGCGEDLVAAAGYGACSHAWRGWVLGTGMVNGMDHVVITASPKPASYTHLVNGPSWYAPTAYVRPLGWAVIHGWWMRAVYVPAARNEGSAFMNHVALIWTTAGHTYGVGVDGPESHAVALRLAETLARQLVLTRP